MTSSVGWLGRPVGEVTFGSRSGKRRVTQPARAWGEKRARGEPGLPGAGRACVLGTRRAPPLAARGTIGGPRGVAFSATEFPPSGITVLMRMIETQLLWRMRVGLVRKELPCLFTGQLEHPSPFQKL